MKHLLRTLSCGCAIAFFSLNVSYAQIKGNPQMKGNVQQLSVPKSSSKVSPELKNLHDKFEPNSQASRPAASSDALQNFMQIRGDKVLVDFTANNNIDAANAELQKIGVTITGVYGRVISGFIPISALPKLEATTSIRFAMPSYKPMHQPVKNKSSLKHDNNVVSPNNTTIKQVISQGDTAQRSDIARRIYHVTGKGVKVGILSDSYDNLRTVVSGIRHGELPGTGNPFGYTTPVQVVKELDSGGTDEGRQMMEIVHDVAPGAALAFYSAYYGQADFARGIQTLADKGCKVIGDDIYYFAEPFFQDGIIAQSVDIAKKRGVTYFSAAGNFSIGSYESKYRPSNVEPFGKGNGTAHNFSAYGDAPRYSQPLYVPTGGNLLMSFQWDQSSFAASGVGATSDFDIYLTDIDGKIVAYAAHDNIASGEPIEIMGYDNNTANHTFFLTIVKYAGPNPTRIKYNLYDYYTQFYLTDPAIPGILAPTLVGHAKAEGAIACGAVWYLNTPAYGLDTAYVNYFSAEGGVANYFDINGNRIAPLVRKKPNIVAPDGGNVSFSYYSNQDISEDADHYPNFFGTSAATPHAAGVAALMIEAQKLHTITPDQIKGELMNTASDMDDIYTEGFDKKFDFNTGNGFINAQKAVGKVKFPQPYLNNLTLEAVCSDDPSSVRNWKIFNTNPFPVEVSWFVPGSEQSGTITAQSGNTTFSTIPLSSGLPNIAIITWQDNFEFPHFDAEFSTKAKCGKDEISAINSDRAIAATPNAGAIANINIAEVYPNPSASKFRLYLSLANQQATNIDLYSIDGRKLLSKTVRQSNGVVEIDASPYQAGIYLLNIKQGNFNKTIKVIKQ